MESTTEEPGPQRALGRGWLAVLLAGVLVGVAGGTVGWRVSTGGPAEETEAVAPAVAPRDVLTGLPAQVRVPATPADLPPDRAVGPAAFLYHVEPPDQGVDLQTSTFGGRDILLVTRSGEQFRVGRTPATIGPVHQSLSPDGRWLAVRRDGQWWIRDLTGTTERAVPTGYEVWRWSTDSEAVVLAELSQSGRAFAVLAMGNGALRRLDLPGTPLTDVVTLVDGRQLVLVDLEPLAGRDAGPAKLAVTVRNLETGVTRTMPVIHPGQLRPGESFNSFVPLLSGGGTPARVWVQVVREQTRPTGMPEAPLAVPATALVGVDVRSGEPAGRVELAESRKGSGEMYLGVVGAELALTRTAQGRDELVAVDPADGRRRVVTTLPAFARVLVPGEQW